MDYAKGGQGAHPQTGLFLQREHRHKESVVRLQGRRIEPTSNNGVGLRLAK